MSTPLKPFNTYLNLSKTLFSHADFFGKSANMEEVAYSQVLKDFISSCAKTLEIKDPLSDFSKELYLHLVERNFISSSTVYHDLEIKGLDERLAKANAHYDANASKPGLPDSALVIPAFCALVHDSIHGFDSDADIPLSMEYSLIAKIWRYGVTLSKEYPQSLPEAKEIFRAALTTWENGDKFFGLNRACHSFAEHLEGIASHNNGHTIKVWGSDRFASLIAQHVITPEEPISFLYGTASDEAIRKLSSSLPGFYCSLNGVKMRDARDYPEFVQGDQWIMVRLVNEMADKLLAMPNDYFVNADGAPADKNRVITLKEQVEYVQLRFNKNFVSEMNIFKKHWTLDTYGKEQEYSAMSAQ